MGGKSSKETKVPQIPLIVPQTPAREIPINTIPQGSKPMQQLEGLGTKATVNLSTAVLNEKQRNRVFLERVVELFIGSEWVNLLLEDPELLETPLKGKPSAKAYDLLRAFFEAIKSTGEAKAKATSKLVDIIEKISNENKDYAVIPLFLSAFLTSARLAGIKETKFDLKGAVCLLQEIFAGSAEDYEGSILEELINSLIDMVFKASCVTRSEHSSFTQDFAQCNDLLSSPPPLTASSFNPPILSLQDLLYQNLEEIDIPVAVQSLAANLRASVRTQLEPRHLDLSICSPTTRIISGCTYCSFNVFYGLGFGYVAFDDRAYSARVTKMMSQVYVEDKAVFYLPFNTVSDFGKRNGEVAPEEMRRLLPNVKALISKLSLSNSMYDLMSDYDAMVVHLAKDGRHYYNDSKATLNDFLDNGNINDVRVYFSPNSEFLSETKYRILIKDESRFDSITNYCYLLVADHDDTLEVLFKRFHSIIFEEDSTDVLSESVKKEIFANLIVSTKGYLTLEEHTKASKRSRDMKLSPSTPLKKLMTEIRDVEAGDHEGKQMIDLVCFVSLGEANETMFIPNNVDQDLWSDPNSLLKLNFNSFFNLMATPSKEEMENLTEDQIRKLLPTNLFCNVENISKTIEMPSEFSIDFLKPKLEETGLALNNKYRAIGYLAERTNGETYIIRTDPNKLTEVHSSLNGFESRCLLEKVNPNRIKAVYFKRCEFDQ
jgi:hypothetical protein